VAGILSGFAKIKKDARTSVDLATRGIRLSNQLEQTLIFDRTWRERLMDPLVEPTPSDSKDLAQPLNRKPIPLGMNEGVLYSDSLAKYAADFFRMSRSSWVRRSSARSFKISFFASSNSSLRFSSLFGLAAFTHLYRLCGETPSRAATS
jgi:hypothetical protein